MARLAEPQVPDVCIEEALSRRPILFGMGPQWAPSQDAPKSFAKLQYAAPAIEPQYIPFPAPELALGPWTPHEAECRRAIESLDVGHPGVARMTSFIAGELAGAW